jgi:hypothetical protein
MNFNKKKALWVSEDLHSLVKGNAGLAGLPVNKFVGKLFKEYLEKKDGIK